MRYCRPDRQRQTQPHRSGPRRSELSTNGQRRPESARAESSFDFRPLAGCYHFRATNLAGIECQSVLGCLENFMSVSVYIREHGTRCYIPANPKPTYPAGTAFVLRDEQHRKRKWKTLPCHVLNVKSRNHPSKIIRSEIAARGRAADRKWTPLAAPLSITSQHLTD